MAVQIEVLSEITDEVAEAFGRLLPQLSTSAAAIDRAALQTVVTAASSTVLVARWDGRIAGSLTLVMFPIPTGLQAIIEDVVVDEAARGLGIGEKLTREALTLAEQAGARRVDLTSRPSRQAAGRLYERVGFRQRDSRVYRYSFG
ncbi:MAG TPA: GNAT family N-acetyltransferase [Streptosporangiaceae bacterium]